MKKNRVYIFLSLFFVITLGVTACHQSSDSEEAETRGNTQQKQSKTGLEQYSGFVKMMAIEQRIDSLRLVQSLSWEEYKKDSLRAHVEVHAYINDDGVPVKMIEYFNDGNLQPFGNITYYLDNNKLVYSLEKKTIWLNEDSTKYIEKRTIFNDGKPALTQVRSTTTLDPITNYPWEKVETVVPSIEKARNILNGEGRFKLHFISVINAKSLFLLLGEAKPKTEDRYTTAIRVEKRTPFIQDLLSHLEEYKFRPLSIQFAVVGGKSGQPKFRVLTGIRWDN